MRIVVTGFGILYESCCVENIILAYEDVLEHFLDVDFRKICIVEDWGVSDEERELLDKMFASKSELELMLAIHGI